MSRTDRVVVVMLALIGLWTVFGPRSLGWEADSEVMMLRVLTGFLFLFLAGSILEKHRLRGRVNETAKALNMLLYGKNYERDREAIRILLTALASTEEDVRLKAWENLKRLTGQEFALDAEVWRSWWAANEKRFALKAKRPE